MRIAIAILSILTAVAAWSGCSRPAMYFPAVDMLVSSDTLDEQPGFEGMERLRQRAYNDMRVISGRSGYPPWEVTQRILAWRTLVDHRPLIVDRVLILHIYTVHNTHSRYWMVSHYYRQPQRNDDWYLSEIRSALDRSDGVGIYDHPPTVAEIVADTRWVHDRGGEITRGAVRERTWRSELTDPPIDISR